MEVRVSDYGRIDLGNLVSLDGDRPVVIVRVLFLKSIP